MAIYMTDWYRVQNEIEALRDSAQKDQRKTDHEAHQVHTRTTNPEPIERAFVSILSSSDCSKIAAYLIQDNKDKDLAESALTLFKQKKIGPRLSKEMLTIWNDPGIRCVDKARSTLDYILMFQLSNPEITVAKLTNDMF
jgi:DNA replication protein DnaD